MSKKILGIGNAIVDVFVKVDDNFLLKNKLVKGSMKLIEKSEFESLKSTIKIEKIEAGLCCEYHGWYCLYKGKFVFYWKNKL